MGAVNLKIGLGTAQFGQAYGITNTHGVLSHDDVCKILSIAIQHNIDMLDTAQAYGDAEIKIGTCLGEKVSDYKIVSKISLAQTIENKSNSKEALHQALEISLQNLGVGKIYGLLVHDPEFLKQSSGTHIWRSLEELRHSGRVEKIGVSVYDAEEIDHILETCAIDLIQLPFNALDRRLLHSGHLEKLKNNNIEIHARSIFLQGVLLCPPEKLPDKFFCLRDELKKLDTYAKECATTPQAVLMQAVWQTGYFDRLILGTASLSEYEQLVSAQQDCKKLGHVDINMFTDYPETIYDPRLW